MIAMHTNIADIGGPFQEKEDHPINMIIQSNVANSPLLIFLRRHSRWMQGYLATLYYTLFGTP